jgi:hypothetical protein
MIFTQRSYPKYRSWFWLWNLSQILTLKMTLNPTSQGKIIVLLSYLSNLPKFISPSMRCSPVPQHLESAQAVLVILEQELYTKIRLNKNFQIYIGDFEFYRVQTINPDKGFFQLKYIYFFWNKIKKKKKTFFDKIFLQFLDPPHPSPMWHFVSFLLPPPPPPCVTWHYYTTNFY